MQKPPACAENHTANQQGDPPPKATLPEPCKSCEFREVDFGGCRCQAFALTGDAGNTDPACTLSPMHEQIFKQAEAEAADNNNRFIYRNFAGGTLETGGDYGA